MGFNVRYDEETGIAFMEVYGESTLPELVEAVAALSPAGRYVSRRRLWDLRKMIVSVTPDELELLARAAVTRDTGGRARVAIVAEEELTLRLSNLFEAHRSTIDVSVKPFRSYGDALAWLQEEL